MSIRTLLIWIILAGTLGGAVLAIQSHQQSAQPKPDSSVRTLGFDPADTIGLSRTVGDEHQILERDLTQPDRWLIHWSNNGLDHRWGVDAAKARGGVRALATADVVKIEQDPEFTPAGELIIRQKSGNSIRVEFGASSSGGYTPIRVEERDTDDIASGRWYGRVEKSLSDEFVNNGMLRWRQDRLFEIPNSAIRTVELEAGGTSVALARTPKGWMLTRPIQIHAERDQVEHLIEVLRSLRASNFVDTKTDPQTSGIDTPIATIHITTADNTSTLTIGTRADVDGSTVYGHLDTPSDSALITLDTNQLSKLTAVPEAYISKTPTPLARADIRSLVIMGKDNIARLKASRVHGEWTIGGSPVDSLNQEAIDRLIGVLTQGQAQLVSVLDDEPPTVLGSIELISNAGTPLARLSVALDSTQAGMRLLLIEELGSGKLGSGKAVRWAMVSNEAAASGAWLTAVASKRPPKP